MSHEAIFFATCNAMVSHCKLQGRLPRVTPHVCNQSYNEKIALQVAEKVEAASTFHNAMRQVAVCDTPTATCLTIFLRRNQSQYDNQNATDIFKYSAGVKYNLIAGRKTSCVGLTS